MDRKRLKEYRAIEAAIKSIKKDIERTALRIDTAKRIPASDSVKGSSTEFPYIETVQRIQGYNIREEEKLLARMRRKEAELQDEIAKLEDWLEGVEDGLTYSILRLKLRNGLSDAEIGRELGYSRSRITQIINDCLKED